MGSRAQEFAKRIHDCYVHNGIWAVDEWRTDVELILASALAAARREERERCAELADEAADFNPNEAGNTYDNSYQWGYKECAERLAAKIRALDPADEEGGGEEK